MTALVHIPTLYQDLPGLIDRAASMLAGAKTAAEVLEAREAAGLAYDMATVGTELRAAKLHPYTRIEIDPICPLQTRTLWVIHETRPSQPPTP